jgi:hypothetical protein
MVEASARALRSRAIADGYAGLGRKEVAFGLALMLDELAAHLGQLSDDVRRAALECCAELADGSLPRSP